MEAAPFENRKPNTLKWHNSLVRTYVAAPQTDKPMRLTQSQINAILAAIHSEAGAAARVILFGSRLDDNAHGGDVDLLVESERGLLPLQRARLKMSLEDQLHLSVDILAKKHDAQPTAFQRIALAQGVEL